MIPEILFPRLRPQSEREEADEESKKRPPEVHDPRGAGAWGQYRDLVIDMDPSRSIVSENEIRVQFGKDLSAYIASEAFDALESDQKFATFRAIGGFLHRNMRDKKIVNDLHFNPALKLREAYTKCFNKLKDLPDFPRELKKTTISTDESYCGNFLTISPQRLSDRSLEVTNLLGISSLELTPSRSDEINLRGCESLKNITALKLVSHNNPHFSDMQCQRIAETSEFSNVEYLSLSDAHISNAGINLLLRSRYFKRLSSLNLSGNFEMDWEQVIGGINNQKNLSWLNLSDCRLNDDVVCQLVNGKVMKNLAHLSLHDTGMSADAVRALAESENSKNLQELDLSSNVDIGDEGADALINSENLPKLERLAVNSSEISPEKIKEIMESKNLPQLSYIQCGAAFMKKYGNNPPKGWKKLYIENVESITFIHPERMEAQEKACEEQAHQSGGGWLPPEPQYWEGRAGSSAPTPKAWVNHDLRSGRGSPQQADGISGI